MILDPCKKCETPYDFTCYLKDMDLLPVISGVIVIFGSIAAYSPQIFKLHFKKSVDGISLQLLHLGVYDIFFITCNYYMT